MLFVRGGSMVDVYGSTRVVESFCLDITEVTVAAFELYLTDLETNPDTRPSAKQLRTDAKTILFTNTSDDYLRELSKNCNFGKDGRTQHPINCVTLQTAGRFCNWRKGTRLPTRWEWEWAARGGSTEKAYPWGPEPPSEERLNACDKGSCQQLPGYPRTPMHSGNDGYAATAPVGEFPKTDRAEKSRKPKEFKDLAGNVWEFVSCEGSGCALKGGSFRTVDAAWILTRNTNDISGRLDARSDEAGFRCAAKPQ
ncbi:SUMF1/EgtB/PvdO family nonheme iron enzyme [Nannocystis sp. ILAH1]|uniref:formylglycine-generating enzyme family protein n=1 Tax=Nannocystis sp. ILAH1 TaxID=2996789 RepID=UPI00226E44FD|nr:SUMF1/EgtB/PvdO family nonheme iron enzyme [Nannocystis sp. ILAH1]MCY0992127.1 SUMF1/EgtB/PvdO family nonheme iron enzyme [Nannocystis sp. ILAH1]